MLISIAGIAARPLDSTPYPPPPPLTPAAASYKAQREAQAALRLLRELLKRDYAVGYLFLSWLLRTSWTLVPAVASLLGLPNPTDRGERRLTMVGCGWLIDYSDRHPIPTIIGTVKQQLPALLLWLAAAGVEGGASGDGMARVGKLAEALSPEQLEELGRNLQEPSPGMAVFAQYLRAQQALEGAPATVEQVGGAGDAPKGGWELPGLHLCDLT